MAAHRKFYDSEIAGALAYAKGNQSYAARLLHCSRHTVYRYVKRQS